MIRFRNNLVLALAFLAAAVFLSFSLGGDFLHQSIHKHATQASHDECPLYQILVQAIFLFVVVSWGLSKVCLYTVPVPQCLPVFRQKYLLPGLRAPPVSL